ncbi:MAG: hypothetical protein EOP62_19610 [Sphingomonadales bacterium]|nr:MAG: hypothetical protein EOP62_19610 [Sphingomonadales bacterium]
MAHFYFHIRREETLFEDRRGGEFPDVEAVWVWAESDARAMIREGQISGPVEAWWTEICDTTGGLVATLPFVGVLN